MDLNWIKYELYLLYLTLTPLLENKAGNQNIEKIIEKRKGLPETHTAKSEKHTKYRNAHNFAFEDSKS
jgi:predicted component of viral defense system (DUF524 family)